MQFPFQEIYIKSTHNSALRSFVSKGSACNIRTWSGKTSEDGRSRIRTWVYGSIRRQEIRSTEVLMVSRSEALQGQKIRRCCTKLFDSDDNQTLYSQTSDQKEVQVAGYAD